MPTAADHDQPVNLFDAVAANRAEAKTPFLDELRARLVRATNPIDVANITARIIEVEARIAALPADLPLRTRDRIAMLEGQVVAHSRRYDRAAERDIESLRAEIAALFGPHAALAKAA